MAGTENYVLRLGEIMVQQGWIRWAQLEEALEIQRKTGYLMGDIVVKRGYMDKKEGSILFLGEILVRNSWISWESLETALEIQRENGKKLGDILLERKMVSSHFLYNALAIQHNIPFVKLDEFSAHPEALQLVPSRVAWDRKIVPLVRKDHVLVIAIGDPVQMVPHQELCLEIEPECKIHFVLACPDNLETALRRYYPDAAAAA
jgi:hypothetical protein